MKVKIVRDGHTFRREVEEVPRKPVAVSTVLQFVLLRIILVFRG